MRVQTVVTALEITLVGTGIGIALVVDNYGLSIFLIVLAIWCKLGKWGISNVKGR